MSYCRCGKNSDVYVYASGGGLFNIHVAYEKGGQHFFTQSRAALKEKLQELAFSGINVPTHCLDRIDCEIAAVGKQEHG